MLFLIQGDLGALLSRKREIKTMSVVRLALDIARSISQFNNLIHTIVALSKSCETKL